MRKIIALFAASALLFAGCSKAELEETIVPGEEQEEVVASETSFVCSFALNNQEGTKTTIKDASNGYNVYFQHGDKISVTNGASQTLEFTASGSGAEVEFTTTGNTKDFFRRGYTYTATYGTDTDNYSVSSGSANHIYMTAKCGDDHKFVFTTTKAVLAVSMPSTVNATKVEVTDGTQTITLTSSSALGVFYVPVPAGSHRYEIKAYDGSNEIAESMKMWQSQPMAAQTVYPFEFTPTLKITSSGAKELKSYPATYKVWICNEGQTGGATISDDLTIGYASGAAQNPAKVVIDAHGSNVSNLAIDTENSTVEISNGESATVKSKTSKSTFVVKPTYTIGEATVKQGSITVEGKKDGNNNVRNVDKIILDYGSSEETMQGVVVTVAKVTYGDPVIIKNNTTATGKYPITVVGTDNTGVESSENGGFKVEGGQSQKHNINPVSDAVAKIGNTVYSSFAAAVDAANSAASAQTILLIDDCETGSSYDKDNPLSLTKAGVTLDLNGKELTETNNFSFVIAADNIVVKNGKVTAGANTGNTCGYNSYAMVVGAIEKGAKITGVQIEDVTFKGGVSVGGSTNNKDAACKGNSSVTIKNCDVTSGDYCVIYAQPLNSEATVLSGNFTTVSCYNSFLGTEGAYSTITIKGGTYNADPSKYVADGYKAVKSGNLWTVIEDPAAVIGSTTYLTLPAAITAATDGATITVLRDLSLTDALLASGKTVTIDVNGKTITSSATNFTNQYTEGTINFTGAGAIEASGKIRLNDASAYVIFDENFTGKIDYSTVYNSSGHLQFIGGYFKPASGYDQTTYANYYIPQGYFIESVTEGTYAGYYKATKITAENAYCQVGENYFIDIKKAETEWNKADGNTLKLLKDSEVAGYLYPNPGAGKTLTLDLNGKTLSAASGYSNTPIDMGSGTLIVTGNGTIKSNYSYKNIKSNTGCSLEIVNGTFANGIEAKGNSLTITDGTFGNIAQQCTTMTISAGTFTGTIQNWKGTTTTINGGTFNEILIFGTLNVTNGEIDHITGQTDGVVNISGGHIKTIYKNSATWNITGGTIDKENN